MVLGLSAAAATRVPGRLAARGAGHGGAGLALLAALGAALATAVGEPEHREAALITFVVSASGVTLLSVTAAAWGLVAGLAFLALQRWTVRPPSPPPSPATDAPRTATRT